MITRQGVRVDDARLETIELDLLDDHPQNPRITYRVDVIASIVQNIKSRGFLREYAIVVRQIGDRYQVVSGHHRKRAAAAAGLKHIWAWVKDIDDDSAFMELVISNSQGELDPLEIGLHACQFVQKGKGGRGKKGGYSEYAKAIGKDRSHVTRCRSGAEVAMKLLSQLNSLEPLLGKTEHLAAIFSLPESTWPAMVELLVDRGWSVNDTKERVKRVSEAIAAVPDGQHEHWLDRAEIARRVATSLDFTATSVGKLVNQFERLRLAIADSKYLNDEDLEKFTSWAATMDRAETWNARKVEAKVNQIVQEAEANQLAEQQAWVCGPWADSIGDIRDGSVNLLLTDPPYGMGYQSSRRKEKFDPIAADESLAEAADEVRQAMLAMWPKMADNSHVLVFCRWDSVCAFQASIRSAGFAIKGVVVWVKNHHTAGDLRGGFAPKHELIIHAVKGSPQLVVREPDVIECDRVTTNRHSTEKPTQLLERLILATTVPGGLVVDLFGGVASTLVAAKAAGRRFFGCELDDGYHAIGADRLAGNGE